MALVQHLRLRAEKPPYVAALCCAAEKQAGDKAQQDQRESQLLERKIISTLEQSDDKNKEALSHGTLCFHHSASEFQRRRLLAAHTSWTL